MNPQSCTTTVHPLVVASAAVLLTLAALHSPVLPAPFVSTALKAAVLCLTATVLLPGQRYRRRALVLSVLVLLPLQALEAGQRWQRQLLPEACERQAVRLEGITRGLPRRFTNGDRSLWRVEIEVLHLDPVACAGPGRIQAYIDSETATAAIPPVSRGEAGPIPGTRLIGEARLRRPWGQVNPAARSGERRFLIDGLHAVGSLRSIEQTRKPSSDIRARLDRARERLSKWVRDHAPAATGPLLAALAVGDQRFMDEETWDRLRVFGLTHLLVISGMHVSLAALPGWCFGRMLARILPMPEVSARLLPSLLALLGSGFYAALAGFSLPTRRALLMLLFLALPRLIGRRAGMPATLGAVILLLLLVDPLAVLSSSFWLSVGAVGLLTWYLASRPQERGVRRLFSLQLFLVLAMVPAGLFFFASASTVGALGNLLAIPLVSLWIVPLLLASLGASVLCEDPALLLLALASAPLAVLWNALATAEAMARSTLLTLAVPAQALWPLILAACLCLLRGLPGRRALFFLLLVPLAAAAALRSPPRFELTVFDVGQGLAILVHTNRASLLVDTGPGLPGAIPIATRTLLPALRSSGLAALDLLVISHPDSDHDGGETRVREQAPPRRIRRGVASGNSTERCRTGRREVLEETLEVMYLSGALRGDSDNNASCALLLIAGERRFLLPGDIDDRRERDLVAYWGRALEADVLIAAHHGSGSSTSRLWLRHVSPRHVVVTAGRANRFGHPASRVVDAAQDAGAQVLNTAHDGALVYRITEDGALRCRRLRHRWSPFWRQGKGPADCSPAS